MSQVDALLRFAESEIRHGGSAFAALGKKKPAPGGCRELSGTFSGRLAGTFSGRLDVTHNVKDL